MDDHADNAAPVPEVSDYQNNNQVYAATPMYTENSKTTKNAFSGLLGKLNLSNFTKESRAYLAEYAVLLIITISLLWLASALFSGVLDYLGKSRPAYSPYVGGFAYTASLAMLAGVAVLVPVFMFLTKRTKGSEALNPDLKNLGWRKAFLGLFLVHVSLVSLGYAVALMYHIFSWLASRGLGTAGDVVVWKSLLKHGFVVGLFVFTSWLYARDYRTTSNPHNRLVRLHRYGLVCITIILSVVFIFTVLREQRGAFIDSTITSDLRTVASKVRNYESRNNRLPRSIDDLELNKELKAHAKTYKYEYRSRSGGYELCAVFRTDTKDKKSSSDDNPLERFSSGGSSYDYDDLYRTNESDDPGNHGKGRQCFNYTSYSSRYNDDYLRNNSLDVRGLRQSSDDVDGLLQN